MIRTEHDRARGGFTLIEVLLVVAILGILASVVVVNLSGRQEKAQIQAARASIAGIGTAIDIYEVDTGKFPTSLQSLMVSDGSPNWNGPYFKGGSLKDPWGQNYAYTREGGSGYKIISGGPDGSVGGPDDITSF
ncbi:MAG: type II secretion system major pseudopilin GspG [Verrucomicrobia bacterium]|nr:type II secretion system major pseudopilin GspG [Verrucomicrobiota bacterium]